MTVRRLLISLSLCVAGAASSTPLPAYAQAQQGEIRGHLRDSAGQPLAGMRVSVLPASGDVPLAIAASDRSGAYDLPHIPFGEYRLVVDRPGIRAQRISLHVPLLDMDAAPSTDAPAAVPPLHAAGQPADTTWPNKEEQDQSARPVFQAAGMHGTTAPSGYSAGASEEDMAELQQDVSSLLPVAGSLASQPMADCGDAAALRATLAHAPTDFNAQYGLGRFYLAQQNFPLAVDHLSIASRLRPQAADVSQALTLALLGAGRTTEAEQALAEAMRLHPRTASLLLLSAQVRGARGDRAGSRLAYLDASHADPTVDELYAAGMGLEQLGDRDDALEVVNRGLQRQPHAAALHTALGILLALEHRKSDAAQALLTALDEDPEFTPAYHTLAQLVRVSYETDRAIAERTRRYVDSHPRNADVLYDDAWIRWKMNGDPAGTLSDEAIASELRLALSLDPSLAEAHFLLGTLYSDTGQPSLAASEFHRVLELDPHRAQALYHLALADRRLGHPEASQEEMKRFLHMQNEGTPDSSRLSSPAAIDIRRGISPTPCPGGITSSPTHP